jgi:bifunctional non-homologous end joining protein LigD
MGLPTVIRQSVCGCDRNPGAKIRFPPGFIPPCLPSPSQQAPSGSAWVHEIKHDGYRLMARRDGNRVRLFTRRGYDWSGKYPWMSRRCDPCGSARSPWTGKRFGLATTASRTSTSYIPMPHDHQVFLYAFDLLVSAEGGKAARTVA